MTRHFSGGKSWQQQTLTFVLDPAHAQYAVGIALDQQVKIIKSAHGHGGSNRDYVLANLCPSATGEYPLYDACQNLSVALMHLLLSEANHFDENQAYDIRQTAGDIVILSHAATELKVIANQVRHLHEDEGGAKNFPKIRLMHLGYLGHPATIDKYLDDVVANAKIVIVRLLGGESYWQYGVRQLYALCKAAHIELIMLSGDNNWDESLRQLSLVNNQFLPADIYAYFCAGGVGNHQSALKLLANHISKIAGGEEASHYKINPARANARLRNLQKLCPC